MSEKIQYANRAAFDGVSGYCSFAPGQAQRMAIRGGAMRDTERRASQKS